MIALALSDAKTLRREQRENLFDRGCRDANHAVRAAIIEVECVLENQCAAGEDHTGNLPYAFVLLGRLEEGIRVYPSKANMFLVELLDGYRAEDLTVALLVRYGIYVRLCTDKVGLNGEFVRIASRTKEENVLLAKALTHALVA